MMLVPRRNSFDLFDDFFEDSFLPKREKNLMKTDIREGNDKYFIDIELPGFEKDNINISLSNGYLDISAKMDKESHNKDERYVRKERFMSECSRSFYVGDSIEEKDIDAEFKNGVLKIKIPKVDDTKKIPETKHIAIK